MIVLFFLLAYGITWGALIPLLFLGPDLLPVLPPIALLILAARFGPSLAGLVGAAASDGPRGLADLVERLALRPRDLGWLTLALAAPMAVAAACTRALVVEGIPAGPVDPPRAATVLTVLLSKLLLDGGLGQELGWRGFALPRLQRLLPPVPATLLLGIASALWHWPAFRIQAAESPGESFALFVVTTAALAVVFTWLYNRTGGNVLVCAVLHASVDATRDVMEHAVPFLWTNGMADGTVAWTWCSAAVALVVGTRGRLGYRGERDAA